MQVDHAMPYFYWTMLEPHPKSPSNCSTAEILGIFEANLEPHKAEPPKSEDGPVVRHWADGMDLVTHGDTENESPGNTFKILLSISCCILISWKYFNLLEIL